LTMKNRSHPAIERVKDAFSYDRCAIAPARIKPSALTSA
jgi:hypothetical protein